MNILQKALARTLYKKSLYDFVKAFWNVVDPAKFVDGVHVQYYCELFQYKCKKWAPVNEPDVIIPKHDENTTIIDVRGNKTKLNINVPPRHMKSLIFNVFGPVWLWLSYPVKAVSVSHTGDLAVKMNEKRKLIIDSELFKELFDDIEIISNSKSYIRDNRGGELYSVNRESFTGYGGDIIINDDITNAETAKKDKEEMNNAWSYYINTMPSRVNDLEKCLVMNIQQRLAPNDITGRLLNEPSRANQYDFVVLPAIFQNDTIIVFPISGKVVTFKKGDKLWPEKWGDYEALRLDCGESIFQTQYLQKPTATDAAVIHEQDIIEKDITDVPSIENADMIYASHDFPVKDKDSSDFLGSVLGYRINSTLYLSSCLEKRMAFVKSVKYVEQLAEYYPGIIQIIEDKANGSPIIEQTQDSVAGIQAFQPGTQSKVQRMESASMYISNVVFIRDRWDELNNKYELSDDLTNLKRRLLDFPFVQHDDICDAFSMLLLFVFLDKRYSVYGRAFNDKNIIEENSIKIDYSTVFFNKEGDNWKSLKIGVAYSDKTKLIVTDEFQFKASIEEGLDKLKEKYHANLYIDCSSNDGLTGISNKNIYIEHYSDDEFDRSVSQLNLAFTNKRVLLYKKCRGIKGEIETFKFAKSKDENVKYVTEKDGFIACLRIALRYYGGII